MSTDVTRVGTTVPPTGEALSDLVAEEIRAFMGRKRVTGAELARRLQVSQMWVSYRLNGKQPIDLNDLQQIASALNMRIVDLLPREVVTGPLRQATGSTDRPLSTRPTDRRPRGHMKAPTGPVTNPRPRILPKPLAA